MDSFGAGWQPSPQTAFACSVKASLPATATATAAAVVLGPDSVQGLCLFCSFVLNHTPALSPPSFPLQHGDLLFSTK